MKSTVGICATLLVMGGLSSCGPSPRSESGSPPDGQGIEDELWRTGRDAAGQFVDTLPFMDDGSVRLWGQGRYGMLCAPCHDARGTGRGPQFERTAIHAGNFHDPRLRAAPDGQIFDTITHGRGLMVGLKHSIPVEDRWAIVAYVRQLQEEGP